MVAGPPSKWPLLLRFAILSKGLLTLYLSSISLLHCTDILLFMLSVICFYYVLCQIYTFEVEVEKNCTCKSSNWIISIDRWTLWTDRQSDSSITPFSKCDIVITLPFSTGLILGLCPANERRRYKVTLSLIGWVQIENQPYSSNAWKALKIIQKIDRFASNVSQCILQ